MENRGVGPGRLNHVILLHKQYNSRGLSNYRGATETDKPQALILALLHLWFLIACSMQKQREKDWGILSYHPSTADITDSRHNRLSTCISTASEKLQN